jgi:hypothetical protein
VPRGDVSGGMMKKIVNSICPRLKSLLAGYF